ncbi:hypothetical protein ACFQO7_24565 [Catellatospora aurea]|uniref:Uncharacterized protein n=1 Tax=Catellatospora aurea TaxID=1337874 RepID=A0ABW2H0C3_9ACTN
MNADIDTLVQQLHSRAEGPVDSRALLARVELAHRRRRSRRAVAGAVAAVSLVVAVAFASLAPHGGHPSPPGSPQTGGPRPVLPSGAARAGDVHQVPALPGIGSLNDASDVGADPFAVHFDTGRFAHPVATAQWSVADGVEELTFYGNTEGVGGPKGNSESEYYATVTMAGADRVRTRPTAADFGSPSPVATQRPSIAGVAAVVETVVHRGGMFDGQQETTVRWQPVARVDVVVSVRGAIEPADVVAFATGLRFDRASRCAVPLRWGGLPARARVSGCAFRLSNFASEPGAGRGRGDLMVSGPNGSTLEVRYLGPQGPDPSAAEPNATLANGWKYTVTPTDTGTSAAPNAVIRVHGPWHLEVLADGGYAMDDLLLFAGRLAQAGDPEDPQTWPASAG